MQGGDTGDDLGWCDIQQRYLDEARTDRVAGTVTPGHAAYLQGGLGPARLGWALGEQADATWPHEEPEHDQHRSPQPLLAHQGDDAGDDEKHGKDPQNDVPEWRR